MSEVRVLEPGDEAALTAFLEAHAAVTMFLRGNLAVGGIEDHGERHQGTYVAAFDGDAVTAVACHCWNGIILLAAPTDAAEVARAAARASPRDVQGVIGPVAQTRIVRRALGLTRAPTTMDSREVLFRLDLDDLRMPAALTRGEVTCRRATEEDLPVLLPWAVAYQVEAIGAVADEALEPSVRAGLSASIGRGTVWIAHAGSVPVSMTRFNATTPDAVQVGGVYTPPALRARGHGRAAVAGSLRDARAEGAVRSILFTDERNLSAQSCYRALGYEAMGDYAIVHFAGTHPPPTA